MSQQFGRHTSSRNAKRDHTAGCRRGHNFVKHFGIIRRYSKCSDVVMCKNRGIACYLPNSTIKLWCSITVTGLTRLSNLALQIRTTRKPGGGIRVLERIHETIKPNGSSASSSSRSTPNELVRLSTTPPPAAGC